MKNILFYSPVLSPSKNNEEPIVTTKVGVIRGVAAQDGDYDMYMGIPFGKVPDDNPFGLSQPHPPFEDIFEACDDTAASPQKEEFTNTIIGALDCLHLNIYIPKSKTPLPVMVWIFGGRYEIGFPGRFVYGPKFLMKHNVILVTINYRQGPYGFLCTDTPEIPGNQGLKDILLALRWIKANITDFGGNADNITVFGESSGAMFIDLCLTLEETLFNKAILMSGTVLRPMTVRKYDSTIQTKLAEALGFKTDDSIKAVAYLATIHPHLVIQASLELKIVYRPCVEKKFEGIEQLIPDYPINLPLKNLKDIPIMIGFCDAESMYRHYFRTPEEFRKKDIFKLFLNTPFHFDDPEHVVDFVRKFYIGDKKISKEMLWEVIDFDSDFSFIHPIQRRIREFIKNGAAAVYQYMFQYSGQRNFVKKRAKITEPGACHADDIAYLFDISYDKTPSKEDQLVIDRMTATWTNFAKFGDPTPSTTQLLPVKWLPTTSDASCMIIDTDLSLVSTPLHHRMTFWDRFYKDYGHKQKDINPATS